MDIDLLFTAVERSEWKKTTESGNFESESFIEEGKVFCFIGNDAENYINTHYSEADEVILVVIDPSRIESPVKQVKEGDFNLVAIQGTFSLDAVIDKIKLQKDKNGTFSVRVKHFD